MEQSKQKDTTAAVPKPNRSRLPIATGTKETPPKSQASPAATRRAGSKSKTLTPTATASGKGDSNSTKRQSFVETFAGTIVPQYTQGPQFTPTLTPSSGNSEDRFGAAQSVEVLRSEVKDLTEKLEILKAKRAADQEKLRENDRLRLQVETLSEFKTKVLESQATLQRELKKAKQDARDANEAKDQHAEELSELSEAVEMATLDKEMAEEKAETLQLELEQSNEKIAQLSTELAAIKEEMSGNVDPNVQAANSIQTKQLVAENARMKEALLKLRDTCAHDKHQYQKLLKEAESHKGEVTELSKTKERLEKRCQELEAQVADLQEMNDAALGAEEMVVNLTEKNLNLEEKANQLSEAVADLEALHDVNDQLQESTKELEMELREELHQAKIANANIIREKETLVETLVDRETTIVRFRELVQKLRDENDVLRKNLEEESSKQVPGAIESLQFKRIFEENKAQTAAIDLELRRLEAKEAALHATSEAVKAELDKAGNLKIELENKEETIKELRKVIKAKQEELSEANIRKELAEKKLSNATKNSELSIEKLTRKLEDGQLTLQRKEREFQATLEHFQAEIDSIESEKGELKEKLMSASKQRLLEGIARSAASSPVSASPSHHTLNVSHSGLNSQSSNNTSDNSLVSSSSLMEYARFLQRENWRLKSQKVLDIMRRLKPFNLPKKEDYENVKQIQKDYWKLKHESNTLLCEALKIALDKELTPARKEYLILRINARKSDLNMKMLELKSRADAQIAKENVSGVIKSDFKTFNTIQPKEEVEADAVKVGVIRFPGWEKSKEKPKRVILNQEQLLEIHRLLDPI